MHKILIYTSGVIGDTLILYPLLAKIREARRDAHIVLNNKGALPDALRTILSRSGFIDEFIFRGKRSPRWQSFLYSLPFVEKPLFDEVFYLIRDGRTLKKKIHRDLPLLRKICRGAIRGAVECKLNPDTHPHILDMYASRIRESGLDLGTAVPVPFVFTPEENAEAERILADAAFPADAVPAAVCIGGKSSVCHWPLEKYAELLKRLVRDARIFPVFLGGPGDRESIRFLCGALPPGTFLYPEHLSADILKSACLMSRLKLYIGNDTGSVHMAALSGLRCIVVSSARAPYGMWFPVGAGHTVLRKSMPCEECRRTDCDTDPARCIDAIGIDEVYGAVVSSVHTLENNNR